MEEQNHGRWDRRLICQAQEFLNLAASGQCISRFHLEAAIAYHHCAAPVYSQTNWPEIPRLYDALLTIRSLSGLSAESRDCCGGDGVSASRDPALCQYGLYESTLGELHRRAGAAEL